MATLSTSRSSVVDEMIELAGRDPFAPMTPFEALLDQGYQFAWANERNPVAASECWLEVWRQLKSRLTAGVRTCDDATELFTPTLHLFDWLTDVADELMAAAVLDESYALRGIRYCRELLAQFSGEERAFTAFVRADLAMCLVHAGRRNDGEALLRTLIHENPDDVHCHVTLADLLVSGLGSGLDLAAMRPRREEARSLLERALTKQEAIEYGVMDRLQALDRRTATIARA